MARRPQRWSARQWAGIGLVPAAAFAVHELRYLAAFGGRADRRLAEHGHSYLEYLMPLLVIAGGLALGGMLVRLARAWQTGSGERRRPLGFRALWVVASAGLLGIYAGQELLEGFLATGHPQGLDALFGGGGLLAIPAAVLVALVLALVVRCADCLVELVARHSVALRARRSAGRVAPGPRRGWVRTSAPLARCGAGRAPPGALA